VTEDGMVSRFSDDRWAFSELQEDQC
jgi:hypothetical protein